MIISVKDLKPGMVLDENVYLNNSKIPLMNYGEELNEYKIGKIKLCNINNIKVKAKLKSEETISDDVKSYLAEYIKDLDFYNLFKMTEGMVYSVVGSKEFSYDLSKLDREFDNPNDLSINAAIVALAIGHGYNKRQIKSENMIDLNTLVRSALTYRIGLCCENETVFKSLQPINLPVTFPKYDKESVFSEYNPNYLGVYSKSLLKNYPNVTEAITAPFLYIKEMPNGIGLLGYKDSKEIEKNKDSYIIGKIINTATWYVLIANNIISNGYNPYNIKVAMDTSVSRGTSDPTINDILFENVSVFAKNIEVVLSTGEVAKVVENNKYNMFYPVIEVLSTGEIIDLNKNRSITINRILPVEIYNALDIDFNNIRK